MLGAEELQAASMLTYPDLPGRMFSAALMSLVFSFSGFKYQCAVWAA